MFLHEKKKYILAVLIFLGISWMVGYYYIAIDQPAVHIAFVAPLSGKNRDIGEALRRGVELYVDSVNDAGGIDGGKIVVDYYDDQDDPELAKKRALEIVEADRAVAVIGHHSGECSLAAGGIYGRNRIPAVTPTATDIRVTQGSRWYFSLIFNDRDEGGFTGTYVAKAMNRKSAVIIYEADEGRGERVLAESFERSASHLGVDIQHKLRIDPTDVNFNIKLRRIVNNLAEYNRKEPSVFYLAVGVETGIRLIKLMKDKLINSTIVVPHFFVSDKFLNGFDGFVKEKRNPGFYLNGIITINPMIFQAINKKDSYFKAKFFDEFGEEPGWRSAFAYDAAMLIAEAARHAGIGNNGDGLRLDRHNVLSYLDNMRNPKDSVMGVTGLNFNNIRTTRKTLYVGFYRAKQIIMDYFQYQPIEKLSELSDFKDALAKKRITLFDGKYMYKTDIVHTGVKIDGISDLDFKSLTCTINFYLWFRYRGDKEHVADIEFLNASKSAVRRELIKEETKGGDNYKLYHVTGRFPIDPFSEIIKFNRHFLGVSFYNPRMNRKSLIYLPDMLGTERNRVNLRHMLSPNSGWEVKQRPRIFQDVVTKDNMGSLEYINVLQRTANHSLFNFVIEIERSGISKWDLMPWRLSGYILAICIIAGVFVFYVGRIKKRIYYQKYIIPLEAFLTLLFLLAAESLTVRYLDGKIDFVYLEKILIIFDCLWWMIPAVLLNMAVKSFVWRPIEERTGNRIPSALINSLALMVYILAMFGIIAFVFEHTLTSLLASSGLVAMIIGIAVKINIADIFAGIIINLERPFKIGDKIRVGKSETGLVTDIKWRTTRLVTSDNVRFIIPNSQVSESFITKYRHFDSLDESPARENKKE